ncbi:MAG: DUF885 domain-containing protein, partial [Verrucomicrobiota bacterium]|nr:DUF885 domain-containing protein [Verrucomicrobiota bacterium]
MKHATFLLTLVLAAARIVSAEDDTAKTLHAFFDAEWDYQMEQNPTRASSMGDRRWNDRWDDDSLDAIHKREDHAKDVLQRFGKIDRAKLSVADQLNYDLFKKNLEQDIAGFRFRMYLLPINQRGGIQTADELTEQLRFETVKDYEDWIARLRSFAAHMDQQIALMREGAKAKIMWPKAVMDRVPAQIDKQIVTEAEASPFFKPFKKFSKDIAETDRDRLTNAAKEAITASVIPSFQKLKSYYTAEYLPACLPQVGVWQMPDGGDLYTYLAKRYTTTDLTPQQIHEKGLSEVARIRGEMDAIIKKVGFTGTRAEFFEKLRTDPQFFYKTPEELFEAYQALAKRIDP